MDNDEFMSLYDYLGKAAGNDLGKLVYLAAARKNIPVRTRHVSTSRYTGDVMLYPKSFLARYFSSEPGAEGSSLSPTDEEEDLPF